jgi:hypothetical protein
MLDLTAIEDTMATTTMDNVTEGASAINHLTKKMSSIELSTKEAPAMEGSSLDIPEAHVVLPTSEHTHTIILLHGRGGCGEDFAEERYTTLRLTRTWHNGSTCRLQAIFIVSPSAKSKA